MSKTGRSYPNLPRLVGSPVRPSQTARAYQEADRCCVGSFEQRSSTSIQLSPPLNPPPGVTGLQLSTCRLLAAPAGHAGNCSILTLPRPLLLLLLPSPVTGAPRAAYNYLRPRSRGSLRRTGELPSAAPPPASPPATRRRAPPPSCSPGWRGRSVGGPAPSPPPPSWVPWLPPCSCEARCGAGRSSARRQVGGARCGAVRRGAELCRAGPALRGGRWLRGLWDMVQGRAMRGGTRKTPGLGQLSQNVRDRDEFSVQICGSQPVCLYGTRISVRGGGQSNEPEQNLTSEGAEV